MTTELKKTVQIPIWLITMVIPLLFTFIVVLSTFKGNIEINVKEIDKRLDRIENKLDRHIETEIIKNLNYVQE